MTRRLLPIVVAVLLALPTLPADAGGSRPHNRPAVDARASATIQGTVRAGARPVPHVRVHLVNRNRSARSGKGGAFAFHNLKPGTYTLVARTRQHGSARASLAVAAGQTSDVVLALRLPRPHRGGVATPGRTPGRTSGALPR